MPDHLASPAIFQAGSADMKPISPTVHGAIDYLAVAIFAVAPAVIGLSGWPAALSYALAGIHLLMTLLTDFPAGVIKVIPIALHQWVERIVGPALIILAFVLMTKETQIVRAFFVAMGIIIFAVERLTTYRSTDAAK
jgi:VIT1/CCC1 family predicted Fe2+/Mn2+ transporter